jgi:hypothetical protein
MVEESRLLVCGCKKGQEYLTKCTMHYVMLSIDCDNRSIMLTLSLLFIVFDHSMIIAIAAGCLLFPPILYKVIP